ncbi:cell division protein FtsQ [Marinibacterium profundimaris]|uniref:Cell division protein FtsQ n=2 Tax=Marinibacterium profundimaris TaxID=1679460 RepID=A0A225NST2_9RHOB|nr:cell division protein FtsQ [Marinibacterium profundimaris]
MQPVRSASHDPAPSRLQFRMQRWLLTPGIRLLLRAGLPALIIFAAVSIFLAGEDRREALRTYIVEARASIEERPEFMVNLMAIDGAGSGVSDEIREILPIDFPVSSFDLDLEVIRDTVEMLDPVKSATVRIRPGGILQVDVTERIPVVVWRNRGGVLLLDATGTRVGRVASRADRADLPLIAGEGADARVAEAMEILAAADEISDRLRGLVRMGERRWDVLLDRDQRILLPEVNPVRALERVIVLSEAKDLLARDVVAVDMRLSARPTLRMSEGAQADWWQARHQTTTNTGQ